MGAKGAFCSREYTVELLVAGEWWTPMTIHANTPAAAKREARQKIEKHAAAGARLWRASAHGMRPAAVFGEAKFE